MCGVVSIAAASACAGSTLSSNSTLAFLVFQLTATDFTPLTRLSEFCTVVVHGEQCSPVIRNVAFVGSAAKRDEVQKRPRASANETVINRGMMVLQFDGGNQASVRIVRVLGTQY